MHCGADGARPRALLRIVRAAAGSVSGSGPLGFSSLSKDDDDDDDDDEEVEDDDEDVGEDGERGTPDEDVGAVLLPCSDPGVVVEEEEEEEGAREPLDRVSPASLDEAGVP